MRNLRFQILLSSSAVTRSLFLSCTRVTVFAWGIALLFICSSTQVHAQAINPTGRDLTLQTPLVLNGTALGNLLTTIDKTDAISIEASALLVLLSELASAPLIERIESFTINGMVLVDSLNSDGMTAVFEMATLSLSLNIASTLLEQQTLSFGRQSSQPTNLTEPEKFSGYFNFRSVISKTQVSDVGNLPSTSNGGVQGAIRLAGPVLEFSVDLVEEGGGITTPSTQRLTRRYTRLTTDLPEIESRMAVGDVSLSPSSFAGSVPILGFVIGRNFELSAGRNLKPTGQRQFSIERPSKVTVIVDGQQLRSFNLAAGNYNIADIALSEGYNDLTLQLEDDTGRTETIDFSTFFANQLLAPGETEYSASLGVLSTSRDGQLEYLPDQPAMGLSARYGASKVLTLSHGLQLTKQQILVNSEAVIAMRYGSLIGSVAASSSDQGSKGGALSIEYRSIANQSAWRWGTGFEIRNPKFNQLSSVDAIHANQVSRSFAEQPITPQQSAISGFANLSRELPAGLYFSATTTTSETVNGARRVSASTSLTGGLGQGIQANWSVRLSHEKTGVDELSNVNLSLNYQFDRNTRLNSLFDQQAKSSALGITRQIGDGSVGSLDLQARAVSVQNRETSGSVNMRYTGNRYTVQLDHRSEVSDSDRQPSRNVTTAHIHSSLVFAGNAFGLSREVSNSFAIVDTHQTLGGRRLRLSPSADGESARTDWLGKAVLPNLGVYNTQSVRYDVDNLPLGYDLGVGAFFVAPPFGAGYQLQVGSAAVITVIGVLVDDVTMEPISLTSGNAIGMDDSNNEPIQFFSNRKGKFAISGLAEGSYSIELNTSPVRSFTLTIPANSTTLYRVGTIEIP